MLVNDLIKLIAAYTTPSITNTLLVIDKSLMGVLYLIIFGIINFILLEKE